MMRRKYGLVLLLLAGSLVAFVSFRVQSTAQDKPAPAVPPAAPVNAQPVKADDAEAGIKAITAEYVKDFNAANAKAAALLWTEEGEYVGSDGDVERGRAAIEKSLAELFKDNPKATVEIEVESVRVLGRGMATVEGLVRLKTPGEDVVTESHYTALHVLEDGKWHAASVREWATDPSTDVTTKNIDWIIGDWIAKGDNGEVRLTYKWDENKVFINATYEITKEGKRISSGTQIIGRNPTGGLKSWSFDSSGTTTESIWVRDDTRWVSETRGVLPDGSEVTSLNIFVRISNDSFTWQTTDRAVDDVPLPALPPVKVTRVKN